MHGDTLFVSLPEQTKLSYFVDWRQSLWTPAVEHLVGDPERFRGKTVLEIGCRTGRMSCLFGLLGATVLGVDLAGVDLQPARREAERWNVAGRVSFASYDGTAENIPGRDFDYIFTKSVLVMIPELETFLRGLATKLGDGGELLAAENVAGGSLLWLGRHLWTYRRYRGLEHRFRGVDPQFVSTVRRVFSEVDVKQFYGTVAAIRAHGN
jgi:SAM-dependent methyltransferase